MFYFALMMSIIFGLSTGLTSAQNAPPGPVHFPASTNAVPATAIPVAAPTSIPTLSSPTPATSPAVGSAGTAKDIHDIHGLILIPYEWLWAFYLFCAVIAGVALWAIWRLIRRAARVKAKLPFEIALERLEAARALMAANTVREYAFTVSEIIRVYIEQRFGEKAAHRTTGEFLSDLLQQTDTPLAAHRRRLEDFLGHCDLIKFARWQLSVAELESMHESARVFVLETRPQPEPVEAEGAVANGQAGRTRPAGSTRTSRSQMIHFLYPSLLWLLLLLPVVAFWIGRRGRVASVEYSSADVAREVARESRSRPGWWLILLPLFGAALFIVGLARPQVSHGTTEVQASGVDLMLAIDVSGSMQSLDFKVDGQPTSRVQIVRSVVSQFIDARADDRLGLIEFSGEPFLISPLTLDHDWLRQGLERVQTGTIPDGTAIGDAIAMGVNRLRDQPSKSKVMVLLTDGCNNTGKVSPLLAADAAKALGVKVYTIGIAERGNAPMPVKDNFGQTHIVMVPSDVDEVTLGKIAEETGAKFFRATDTESLRNVYAEIDRMQKTAHTVKRYENVSELYSWAVIPGLFVLGMTVVLEQTRFRRLP